MLIVVSLAVSATAAIAQTQNYYGTSGPLSGNVWSTSPLGPYTSALSSSGGGIINFGNVATQPGGANSISVAGINATANFSITGVPSGTLTNFGNGVIPIDVASGVTLDFGSQAFTTSVTAGYVKNSSGVLALTGGAYGGGFTLNSGTVILRGANAMGSGGTLTINGQAVTPGFSILRADAPLVWTPSVTPVISNTPVGVFVLRIADALTTSDTSAVVTIKFTR